MPTIRSGRLTAQAADILNAIRNGASANYREFVPPANPNLSNLGAIGNPILNYEGIRNEFINALLNRIAVVEVIAMGFTNPLSDFKRGTLELGETIEEIFVGIADVYQFSQNQAEQKVFKRKMPDVKTAFHVMNYQKFYPQTISREQLRQAFLSVNGLEDFITRLITAMYTAMEYDEFLMMKYVLARAILDGRLYAVETGSAADDDEGIKTTTQEIIRISGDLQFPSDKYNEYGVTTATKPENQRIILSNTFKSYMKVAVLASAFNMSEVEFMAQTVTIDSFGKFDNDRLTALFTDEEGNVAGSFVPFTTAELEALNAIPAVVIDKNFLMIYDYLTEIADIRNPMGLYWNYFLHHWACFSTSPFANAVVCVPTTPAVNSVSVTPTTATLTNGGSITLTPTVVTTGFAPKTVSYEVDTGTFPEDSVTVDIYGKVTISPDAGMDSDTVTITVTSTFDETKTATCAITVNS